MRIAIVKLSAMGDIIHAAVVLQFIRRTYPEATIDWFADEVFAGILAGNSQLNAVHAVPLKRVKKSRSFPELIRMVKTLRALGPYDHIIDMQGLIKSALIARLLGKNVHGFDKASTREGAATWLYRHTYAVDYDMNVIKRGASLVSQALHIPISDEDLQAKEPFLFGRGSEKVVDVPLLIVAGASWPTKIYPAEKLAEVVEGLGLKAIVTWGNAAEEAIADRISSLTPLAAKAPKMSLSELIAQMDRARLVIGGDTGPTHIAWALNKPSVTVYGPTPSFRNTLETSINKTVDTGKKIDPSRLNRHDDAIKDIQPGTIIAVAQEVQHAAS